MEVIINYWAVIVAAIAGMVLGFLWYGPVFGKQWMALTGMTKEKMEAQKAQGMNMAKSYVLMIVSSLVMAYVLAHVVIFGNAYLMTAGAVAGLMAGFWSWLGFVAPVILGGVLWEGQSWKLWFLNAGYYLVSLLIMGAILSGWQ